VQVIAPAAQPMARRARSAAPVDSAGQDWAQAVADSVADFDSATTLAGSAVAQAVVDSESAAAIAPAAGRALL